jgi:hypothetical protein
MQEHALNIIHDKLGDRVLAMVPEFDSEIKGLATIKALAEEMFEEKMP